MTLLELFSALTNTSMVVTIVRDDEELAKIYVPGYDQLLESLLAETVSSITITNQTAATVVLTSASA